ncbi:MAG: hypothetical protein ACOCV2_02625 [Persicimonas sp.]
MKPDDVTQDMPRAGLVVLIALSLACGPLGGSGVDDLGTHELSLPNEDGELSGRLEVDAPRKDYDSFQVDYRLTNPLADEPVEVDLTIRQNRTHDRDSDPEWEDIQVWSAIDLEFELDPEESLMDELETPLFFAREPRELVIEVEATGPIETSFEVEVRPTRY